MEKPFNAFNALSYLEIYIDPLCYWDGIKYADAFSPRVIIKQTN